MPIGSRVLALCLWAVLIAAGSLLASPPAVAQSCSLSITPLAFGDVDVTANAQVNGTATATVSCTGSALLPVGVCIELGPGSGGGTSAANRTLTNGANQLHYGLFSDAAASVPWGSGGWPAGGASAVGFNLTLSASGTGSRSVTIYGRVYSGQATAAPVTYSSSFAGTDARVRYGLLSFLLGCELLTVTQSTSFTVSANVPATCRVTTSDLNFGSVGVLATPQDAFTTLAPTCTNGTAYQIGLNGGLSGATNPTMRRMTKGAETITYGLYRDVARSQPFGSTLGLDTLTGIGSGLAQTSHVYGRVPAQATPSPGQYADTIQAVVTY
ncbi:MAG: spore coat protein u [Methylobacterium sp.]|jgi:spore coat protein U-like protein|nr:spore coat protein u [Methylobacterium sp.]